jgi:hypothetical protein
MIAKRWHHAFMLDDDPQSGDPSEKKPAVPTDDLPELSPDPLIVANDATAPALASPVALIRGFRYLQQRIPGFTQLSAEEERSLIRVSSLDPDFIEAGIRAGTAWSETKGIIGRSGEELRHEADEIRDWDEAESEIRAVLKGISAANRKRRHRLGRDILNLYMILGETIHLESRRHLRPHYEAMQRAYQNRKRKRRKAE